MPVYYDNLLTDGDKCECNSSSDSLYKKSNVSVWMYADLENGYKYLFNYLINFLWLILHCIMIVFHTFSKQKFIPYSWKQVKMERDCCEFICGAPTTFQGYGIVSNCIANIVVWLLINIHVLIIF